MIERYRDRDIPKYFRGDPRFLLLKLLRLLEWEGFRYVIRLKANPVLKRKIAPLLKRPVGRPSRQPNKFYASQVRRMSKGEASCTVGRGSDGTTGGGIFWGKSLQLHRRNLESKLGVGAEPSREGHLGKIGANVIEAEHDAAANRPRG